MAAPDNYLTLSDVTVGYGRYAVLESISFNVDRPEFIVVTGPNGGGKTTLLKLILGLIKPWSGNISLLGTTPEKARSRIGYVPQFSETDPLFPISVKEVILMGELTGIPLFPFYSAEAVHQAEAIAEKLHIDHLLSHHFGSLSGGQRQRVLIARALVSQPEMLLLDEPVASVDSHSEIDVYHLLSDYAQSIPVLMVTHDIGFVSTLVQRIICINRTIYDNHDPSHLQGTIEEYGKDVRIVNHTCGL